MFLFFNCTLQVRSCVCQCFFCDVIPIFGLTARFSCHGGLLPGSCPYRSVNCVQPGINAWCSDHAADRRMVSAQLLPRGVSMLRAVSYQDRRRFANCSAAPLPRTTSPPEHVHLPSQCHWFCRPSAKVWWDHCLPVRWDEATVFCFEFWLAASFFFLMWQH